MLHSGETSQMLTTGALSCAHMRKFDAEWIVTDAKPTVLSPVM